MKGILRYVRNGIDLINRPQIRDTRPVKEMHIDTAAELEELTFWAYKYYRLRIWIPANLLVLHGAFRFQGGWNPFVEALNQGDNSLKWYFYQFQLRSLQEMYLLSPDVPGTDMSLWRLPWFGRDLVGQNSHSLKEKSDERRGPNLIASEMRRLTQTRDSILKRGYQPNLYGDIQGCFLKRGDEGRFLIYGGKHRTAVLAAAGWQKIPVMFKPTLPRTVDGTTVHSWPLVRSGVFNARAALGIFNSYFDLDGTQQFSSFSESL